MLRGSFGHGDHIGLHASPVFQLAEHALDDIAAPIDLLIERVWGPSGGG